MGPQSGTGTAPAQRPFSGADDPTAADPERTRKRTGDRTGLSVGDRTSNGRSPSRRAATIGFRTTHEIEELFLGERMVMRRPGLRDQTMGRCGLAPMRNVVDDIVVGIHPQVLPITERARTTVGGRRFPVFRCWICRRRNVLEIIGAARPWRPPRCFVELVVVNFKSEVAWPVSTTVDSTEASRYFWCVPQDVLGILGGALCQEPDGEHHKSHHDGRPSPREHHPVTQRSPNMGGRPRGAVKVSHRGQPAGPTGWTSTPAIDGSSLNLAGRRLQRAVRGARERARAETKK